jgi:uncharacterized membrane protein YeaQ/YmgE (transglycosylase-associated protein family)
LFNFWTVTYLIFVGLVAGFVARLLVPGRDAIGFWWTILLGIVVILLVWRAIDRRRSPAS